MENKEEQEELANEADLLRARRQSQIAASAAVSASLADEAGSGLLPIFEATLVAGLVFLFFDLPQYFVDFISLLLTAGTTGWVINMGIAGLGWGAVYLWLISKGRNPFSSKTNEWKWISTAALLDLLPLIPGISGYIITIVIRERAGNAISRQNKK